MLPGLTFGIVGAILAVAIIAPDECVQIFDLFKQGQVEAAGQLHLQLLPIARAVTSQYGVPGLKAAMNLLGYRGGWPRLPLLPLGASQRSEVEQMLTR
jgi:4-hydroxy-2-oxoglutarate aldolase